VNLARETIQPTDREHWLSLRRQDLTSTVVPALFNLSPYLSLFEAWHRFRSGVAVADEPNASMRWGSRLEPVIAHGIAADEGWRIRAKTEYMRLPEHRIGSSFDYETDAPALLEIKSVNSRAFRNGWRLTEDFGIEAPPHIEVQCQVELLVSGLDALYIGVLTDNDTVHVLQRKFEPDVADAILRKAAEFWTMPEPAPDFLRDAEFIAKSLYGYSAEGKTLEADEEVAALFREYAGYKAEQRAAEDNAAAVKARILTLIGDAERVTHPEFTLSTQMVKAGEVKYFRDEYRSLRLTQRGEKQ
jgi:predicted phage-related endonuclease